MAKQTFFLLLIFLFGLAGACAKPKGESFGLPYGIGMKLDARRIEKVLRKSYRGASHFEVPEGHIIPTAPSAQGANENTESFNLGKIMVSFSADSKGSISSVMVMPSFSSMMAEALSSSGKKPSQEGMFRILVESAKRAGAENPRIRTKNGIGLGSTDKEVENAYGKSSSASSEFMGMKAYEYTVDGYSLLFVFQYGTVVSMWCSTPKAMDQMVKPLDASRGS